MLNITKQMRNFLLFIASLLVVFMVGMYWMVSISVETFESPMDADYYQKGLNYDKILAERHKVERMGYQIQSDFFQQPVLKKGVNKLVFALKDKDGNSLYKAKGRIILGQKASIRNNKIFQISTSSEDGGLYEADIVYGGKPVYNFLRIQFVYQEQLINKTIDISVQSQI